MVRFGAGGTELRISLTGLGSSYQSRRKAVSAPDVGHFRLAKFHRIGGAYFGIAVGACVPDLGNGRGQFFVAGTAASQMAQIGSFGGEQTGIERTLRG